MTRRSGKHGTQSKDVRTLAIDIGGTGIKALILDEVGSPLTIRERIRTPKPATPEAVVETIRELARSQGNFDRISVGFPGVVRRGTVFTSPNLDSSWQGYNLVEALKAKLRKPVRAANDADVQGFGAITREGVELVVTLGTGFGSALFVDGKLVPNLEVAHHPFHGRKTYEEELGIQALRKVGKKKWNQRLAKAINALEALFNYDVLYIGGGNAEKVTLPLGPNVHKVPNVAGLLGGIAFWQGDGGEQSPTTKTRRKSPSRKKPKTN